MNMKDLKELVDIKESAAYEYLGYMEGFIDEIRNGVTPGKDLWHGLDEKRLAYECASRDLDECLNIEATVASFKED